VRERSAAPPDLTELGVTDAARLIALKKVSSVELTEAYLARAGSAADGAEVRRVLAALRGRRPLVN